MTDLVPEGADRLRSLRRFSQLREVYAQEGGYLFLSYGDAMWTVRPALATPSFFRHRFARALGVPERELASPARGRGFHGRVRGLVSNNPLQGCGIPLGLTTRAHGVGRKENPGSAARGRDPSRRLCPVDISREISSGSVIDK